jgi:hypothetical protein
VWNAAHRLGCLVAGALIVVGALLLRDAHLHHGAIVADVSAAWAASLVVGAGVAMSRARRFFGRAQDAPPVPGGMYRHNARAFAEQPVERERECATRCAAGALVALAVAGAFVVVAAASR